MCQEYIYPHCPTLSRTGKFQEIIENTPQIINIDHHGTNERFGHINYATSKMSSTCEFLYFMAKRFGLGKALDIGIIGEKDGLVPSSQWKKSRFKDEWRTGDTINLSIFLTHGVVDGDVYYLMCD